jgi:hypothetical protein
MPVGTIQVERSRWQWVDVYIATAAGVPVTGLLAANFTVNYKKNNAVAWTSKTIPEHTALVNANASIADTELTADDVETFPTSGSVIIDGPAGPNLETAVFTRVPGVNTEILIAAGLANVHLIGESIDLIEFYEVGNGVYTFLFSDTELDTVGQFTVVFIPSSGLQVVREIDIIWAEVTGTVAAPSLPICRLFGHVVDGAGVPINKAGVSVAPLALPETLSNSGVSKETIATETDENGYFQLSALQGSVVDVSVPEMNYRRTITVPSTGSAELFTIEAT